MLLACVCFSLMNTAVFAVSQFDSQLSILVISFFRIACNFLILLVPVLFGGSLGDLLGDRSLSLWLRGVFGSLALILSFYSISRIGPGESTFLNATSGIFVAILGPFLLQQPNNFKIWIAISGAFLGVALMCNSERLSFDLLGFTTGLLSGFLAALAYVMVAKAGRKNAPQTVVFYFCVVALLLHGLYFYEFGVIWPDDYRVFLGLLMVGALGSVAQHLMTIAYQLAPAAIVGAVGYFAAVLSMVWGMLIFSQTPDLSALVGAMLILLFGVMLPFLR